MKVYMIYGEEPNQSQVSHNPSFPSHKIKFVLPKKWLCDPCQQLLSFFVKDYNKSHPETLLKESDLFLQLGCKKIPLEGIVSKYIPEYSDVYVLHKRNELINMDNTVNRLPGSVLCSNWGCGEYYIDDSEHNTSESCKFHAKGPVFHDGTKLWPCCTDKACMDWEEFEKIPFCCVGFHATKSKLPPGNN